MSFFFTFIGRYIYCFQESNCSYSYAVFAGMVSQVSTSNSSTAIGFDERMLLHSEVWEFV